MNFITNTLKQNKYNTKLLFADTDNLVYAIGLMKDEFKGEIIWRYD